jgi:hypothetical protein
MMACFGKRRARQTSTLKQQGVFGGAKLGLK